MHRTLNLGILAHVDAGKTSLTERLLHAAGVIDEPGRVDDGNTQTDTLELERRRGITIKSAVVSFSIQDVTVNLIDTPGHPDFIAEVERVLSVLDGAVLVVSAVEGVQPQTRVLMRALRRLSIPTLIFVNKIDRCGADPQRVLAELRRRISARAVAIGGVDQPGIRTARFSPFGPGDTAFSLSLAELLAEHDDAILAEYAGGRETAWADLWAALAEQTRRALVHPVLYGSAITGAGLAEIAEAIVRLLPAHVPDRSAPVSGTIFKIDRDRTGEPVAYLQLTAGTVAVRDDISFGRGCKGKVTGVRVFDNGANVPARELVAGRIGKLRGLAGAQIGDAVGAAARPSGQQHFAPPTLQTVVVPCDRADRGALRAALGQLAEQDPLINLRQDELREEILLSLYGEVQKEVIEATLRDEYGLRVGFEASSPLCIERLIGPGSASELIGQVDNPFLATVGLRVEPAPVGSGVRFGLEVELGSMPLAFMRAVEETVRASLEQGIRGWPIPDCSVFMTHSGYWARQSHAHGGFDKSMSSTAGDFRLLTPLVLLTAVRRAGTVVHEPIHRFDLELPGDLLGAILPVLASLNAVVRQSVDVESGYLVSGTIPAARVHGLRQRLPSLTRGDGVLDCAFDHYALVSGPAPSRPRTDHNPLEREEYLLHVQRRV